MYKSQNSEAGVRNLQSAWLLNVANARTFVIQIRTTYNEKTNLRDKQVLKIMSEVMLSYCC